MRVNTKDLICGLVFIAMGAFFALNAFATMRVGRAFDMGPGYFPTVVGFILAGFGLAILVGSLGRVREAFGPTPWRGIFLVTAAVLFFALTARSLGMLASLFVATLFASLSTGQLTLRTALLLSLALTAFNITVFVYALRLPYPLFGPWLGG